MGTAKTVSTGGRNPLVKQLKEPSAKLQLSPINPQRQLPAALENALKLRAFTLFGLAISPGIPRLPESS